MQGYNQVLVLITPIELKDELVDQLMGLSCISGFSLNLIDGYSRENAHFNINEQVEGYRQFYRFEILHQEKYEVEILQALKQICTTGHARYWVLPVNSVGHF